MVEIRKIFLAVCFLSTISLAVTDGNILLNGSFEEGLNKHGVPNHWGELPYNHRLITNKNDLSKSLRIRSNDFGYFIGAQVVSVKEYQGKVLSLISDMRGEDIVRDKKNKFWQGAKIQVIFLNEAQREIGKPIDSNEIMVGTFDTFFTTRSFEVPKQAVEAKILIGLWGAKGTVWFDNLFLILDEGFKNNKLLKNGNFEVFSVNWFFVGDGKKSIEYPGVGNKGYALYFTNEKPSWSFAWQNVALPKKRRRKVIFSGNVMYKDIVQGANNWDKGRVYLEFFNKNGERLGERFELMTVTGNSLGWESFAEDFEVPTHTQKIKLFIGLQNCSGEIAFDNLELTISR